MCGIAGYITKKEKRLTPNQKQSRDFIFRGLLLAMQERGTNSTGVAGVHGKKLEIYKKAISAEEFIRQPEFNTLLKKNNRIMLGHTRLATVGEKTDGNSHPFKIGNITGVHNGRVAEYQRVYKDAKVDSEAIFYELDRNNNDVKETFKKLRGAFAITWLDERNLDKLYFMVSGNPMFLIKVPEIDTYFWASTYGALQAVVGSHYTLKKKPFWQPKTDTVYQMNNDLLVNRTEVVLKSLDEEIAEDKVIREAKEKEDKKKEVILIGELADEEKSCKIDKKFNTPVNCDDDEEEESEIIDSTDRKLIFTKEARSEYKQLMNLNSSDMLIIVEKVSRDNEGCMFCNGDIDLEIGFLWDTRGKQVVCMKCGNYFKDYAEFLYITKEEYFAIEDDAFIDHAIEANCE